MAASSSDTLLEPCVAVDGLRYRYESGGFELRVPALEVAGGTRTALIGPSGAGKTTLLHLLAGILLPQQGRVTVQGTEISALGDRDRRALRIGTIGMMFQEFELIEHLSVRENVLLPYFVNRALVLSAAVEGTLTRLAESLGIAGLLGRLPRRLSQGERQRVAACRALVTQPPLILADEPTGNLDPANTQTMLDLVFSEIAKRDATFVMVTHDHGLLGAFDDVIDLAGLDGRERVP